MNVMGVYVESIYGLGIGALLFLLFYAYFGKGTDKKYTIVRALVFLLASVALCNPYTLDYATKMHSVGGIDILVDNSTSMEVCDTSKAILLYNRMEEEMGKFNGSGANLIYFGGDERSAIGDAVYDRAVSSNNPIILISDGNNEYGKSLLDVSSFLSKTDTRVYAMIPSVVEHDLSVSVAGPKNALVDSDYSFDVVIKSSNETDASEYDLLVEIDGNTTTMHIVQEGGIKRVNVSAKFASEGVHKIAARIASDDHFSKNNQFLKIVKVIKKPDILLITKNERSLLSGVLGREFNLTVNKNYEKYYEGIVIDNMPVKGLSAGYSDYLKNYTEMGGGLMVVGGKESYEFGNYSGSAFEEILPVKSVSMPQKKRERIGVVFLIDISGSTGQAYGNYTKVDFEKALAINMINSLSEKDYIGVVAFNVQAYTLAPLTQYLDRARIGNNISKLTFTGGTQLYPAQQKAREMLKNFDGERYVVIISDGVVENTEKALEEIGYANKDDIKTFTVGVGFDTNEFFMKTLADYGGGVYLKPEEYENLKIMFGDEERQNNETTTGFFLKVLDGSHFVAGNLVLSGIKVAGFNEVTTKSSAQEIISTYSMSPVVAVWRYGLGRVASFTLDNGGEWASQVYSEKEGSEMIIRTVSWVVGDLERAKYLKISSSDVYSLDEESIQIENKIGEKPYCKLDGAPLAVDPAGENLYSKYLQTGRTGFYGISCTSGGYADSDGFAVNYPKEYRDTGVAGDLLEKLSENTNAMSWKLDDYVDFVDSYMAEIKNKSFYSAPVRNYIGEYFLLAALLLFFADVAARRVRDILKAG